MAQGVLLWTPNSWLIRTAQSLDPNPRRPTRPMTRISAADAPSREVSELSAREKRKLRNDRRESKMGQNNWREEVEMALLKKPKKRFANWMEELNLDTLADLGPQWWALRVARTRSNETAELIAKLLVRNFPHLPFKLYTPSVKVKRKLKNGSISIKPQPLFPGCIFLRCELNREIHDFLRDIDGVGGFIGSKVGNTKKQINKPRPVDEIDIEAIFKQAKEDQEKHDKEFEEEQKLKQQEEESLNVEGELNSDSKPVRKSRKSSDPAKKKLVQGSLVRVVSGNFTDFEGILKKLNRRTKKATVAFSVFGKESLVELDMDDIVAQ